MGVSALLFIVCITFISACSLLGPLESPSGSHRHIFDAAAGFQRSWAVKIVMKTW